MQILKLFCDGIREPVSGSLMYGNNISAPRSFSFRHRNEQDVIPSTCKAPNLGRRVTAMLSKASPQNSMFGKHYCELVANTRQGCELKSPWSKLYCLKHTITYMVIPMRPRSRALSVANCRSAIYTYHRRYLSWMMCERKRYNHPSSSDTMSVQRSNGRPNGITQPLIVLLRRKKRTLGSGFACSRSKPDGGLVVLNQQDPGRGLGFKPQKIRYVTPKGNPLQRAAIPNRLRHLMETCNKTNNGLVHHIYSLLFKPELYQAAYEKLKSNPGMMTKGSTNETLDGWNLKTIYDIIERLKTESFQFQTARTKLLSKPQGGYRTIRITSPRDKILQQSILFILETIYEPQFSKLSFGFRQDKGCHDALNFIKKKFQATRWFINGDISKCFDEIDHQRLINLLRLRIKDEKFIRLIQKALKAGYLDEWQVPRRSLIGKGSIISPILCNIYLDQFDRFVESELIPTYNKGKSRKQTPQYMNLMVKSNQLKKKYQQWGNPEHKNLSIDLRQQAQSIPSMMTEDPNFRRLYYVRYADDWLIGFAGTHSEASQIRNVCKTFFNSIDLELNMKKTTISKGTKGCDFLGARIHVPLNQKRFKRQTRGKLKARANLGVRINAPMEQIINKLALGNYCDKNGKPLPRMALYAADKDEIVRAYNSVYRGVLNYYSFADNYKRLAHSIFNILRNSCAKVLAAKYKIKTVRQTLRKFGKYLGKGEEVKFLDPKNPSLRGKKFKTAKETNDQLISLFARAGNAEYLKNKVCAHCGSTQQIEMHHIRHLKNLNPKLSLLDKTMAARQRKQIPLCRRCHMRKHGHPRAQSQYVH